MRVSEKGCQRRVALALAHLCSSDDQRIIFIDHYGMDLLAKMFVMGFVHVFFLFYKFLYVLVLF